MIQWNPDRLSVIRLADYEPWSLTVIDCRKRPHHPWAQKASGRNYVPKALAAKKSLPKEASGVCLRSRVSNGNHVFSETTGPLDVSIDECDHLRMKALPTSLHGTWVNGNKKVSVTRR